MNMKTWTNPSVEELEVKLTAMNLFANEPEWDHDDEFEWENIIGNPTLNPQPQPQNPVNPGQKS